MTRNKYIQNTKYNKKSFRYGKGICSYINVEYATLLEKKYIYKLHRHPYHGEK